MRNVPLSAVTTFISRGVSPKYVDEGVRVLNQKCVRDNRITTDDSRFTDATATRINADKFVRRGDVLVNSTGVGTLGRVAQFRLNEDGVTVDSHVTIVRPDPRLLDLRYFGSAMVWREPYIADLGAGATGQTELSRERLAAVEIPVPPLPSQRKVAEILSAYEDLIENNLRRIRILEEMVRALYREWFVEFRFPGSRNIRTVPSDCGRIPAGWRLAALKDLVEVNARSIRRGAEPETVGYIDISSVSTGSIDAIQRMSFSEAPGRARRLVQDGDTIWSCVRPNRKSFSLVLDPDPDFVASTGFAVLTPTTVPFGYVYLAVTTEDFAAYLTNRARGAAYPAVSGSDFEDAPVLKPDGEVLAKFQQLAAPMLRLQDAMRRKNRILRRTHDALLPLLISGDLDVSDLDIAVPGAVA